MVERNIQHTTNDFLKFGKNEIKKKNFHKPKESIDEFDNDIEKVIVSDAFAYGKNKETDA